MHIVFIEGFIFRNIFKQECIYASQLTSTAAIEDRIDLSVWCCMLAQPSNRSPRAVIGALV